MGTLADGCPVAIAGELFFDQGVSVGRRGAHGVTRPTGRRFAKLGVGRRPWG